MQQVIKKTFIYSVNVSGLDEDAIDEYLSERWSGLHEQLKGQYEEEFSNQLLGLVVIPVTGDSSLEVIEVGVFEIEG